MGRTFFMYTQEWAAGFITGSILGGVLCAPFVNGNYYLATIGAVSVIDTAIGVTCFCKQNGGYISQPLFGIAGSLFGLLPLLVIVAADALGL